MLCFLYLIRITGILRDEVMPSSTVCHTMFPTPGLLLRRRQWWQRRTAWRGRRLGRRCCARSGARTAARPRSRSATSSRAPWPPCAPKAPPSNPRCTLPALRSRWGSSPSGCKLEFSRALLSDGQWALHAACTDWAFKIFLDTHVATFPQDLLPARAEQGRQMQRRARYLHSM